MVVIEELTFLEGGIITTAQAAHFAFCDVLSVETVVHWSEGGIRR